MNVPKLRFKADDGSEFPEWEEKRLGDICKPLMYGMGAAAIPYDGQNKYIRITDIDDESHKYKSNDIVSPAGMLEEKYLVCKGDILLARTGASTGKSYLYDEKDGKMYFAGFLIKAHVNEECDAKFIYAQTLTTKYMNWVKLTSMRSGQPGINANEYSSYAVSIACIPEQRKIASFLSTIDEIIQSTESELNAWQERKKGVMQKIFNREVRFKADDGSEFPEWEEKRLGDLFKISSGGDIDKENCSKSFSLKYPYPVYANALVNRGLYGYANYYKVQGDTFTVTGRGDVGCAVARHGKYVPIVRLLVCEPKENDNVDFFAEHVNGATIFVESTGVPQLTAPQLGKVKVKRPSLPEQKKIADCLSSLDDVISNIQAELSAWKEFKKGLLQQMFV